MIRIRNLKDIDKQKLEKLFQKRGHGVTSLLFWTNLQKRLEDPNYEIHQCECGEVMSFNKSIIPSLPKDENENILCKKCGDYEELTENTTSVLKDLFLVEIFTEIYSSRTDNERTYHFQRAIREAKGIIPVRNYAEFEIGLAFHLNVKKRKTGVNYENKWIKLTQLLYNEACKINPEEIKKWNFLEEIIKKKQKLFKSERIYHNELTKYSEIENYPLKNKKDMMLGTFGDVAPLEKKIRHLLLSYRDFYEIALLPDFLMNLINIIEGNSVSLNPFSGKKVKINDSKRKIRAEYTSEKILFLIQNDKIEEELKELLVKTYNNKIRNDVAHSQFHIDVSNRIVYSTKYKSRYSFEEIEKLVEEITKAEITTDSFILEFKIEFEDSVEKLILSQLGYYHLDGLLDENLNPNVLIFQYFYFNKEGKIHEIVFQINDDRVIIEIDEINLILESDMDFEFLDALTKKKSLKLCLVLIAPVMERYQQYWEKDKYPEIIRIEERKFYINSVFEKTILLSEQITKLIAEIIK